MSGWRVEFDRTQYGPPQWETAEWWDTRAEARHYCRAMRATGVYRWRVSQ